ncbi:MAG: PDZ domain-containing protein [Planctomycetaceae bacterium]
MNSVGSVWIATAALLWAVVAAGAEQAPESQIAGWVEQLGAAQFARREAAATSLVDAGQAAIAPLEQAIRSGELEVAARGIEILRDMLAADDPATAAAAERLLDSLAEQGEPPLAQLAASVLDFHLVGEAEQARRAVEEAGAVVRERPLVAGQRGLDVELGPAWRGGVAGLRQLARLRGLTSVSVHGMPIDATAAAVLGRLRGVRRIDLYGTGIPESAVAKLATALPHAVIDVRKGGRLGVSSLAFGGPCEITHVQPGSAAAKAGVQVGDVVIALDGEPIASFEALTQRVSRRGAGDALTLSIARQAAGGAAEQFDCSVTLDAW